PSRQQEVSNNWWLLGIADPALQLDTCERFDSREVVLARESCRRHDHRLAPFVAAMAAGKRLLYLRMFCQRLQQYLRVGKQRRLVGLERQSVLSATVENALGKLGVAVQRVGGDSAAIECQQLQGFQCCGDLVALGRQPLGNRKPRLGGPHVDQLQRRRFAATLERTAQGFAVHRHHAVQLLGKFRQEPAKYWFECLRVEQPEYPAEGIVAWDAVLQPQELAQQSFLGTAKLRHVGAVVRSAQHRRQRNDQHVDQILPRIVRSRVRHVLEKVLEFLHRTTPHSDSGVVFRIHIARQRNTATMAKCDSPVRPRDGGPSCVTTHRTSAPWTCSLFRPLASICSMSSLSFGWPAGTLSGSTPHLIRPRTGSHVRSLK